MQAHGPRATIIAPPGRCFLDFDADSLHLRIAACLSQDPFMSEAIKKYDETGSPVWKPHIQNVSAIFGVSPEEAVSWMDKKDSRYTFGKNWIYLILNGGEVPALRNAASSAGLQMNEKQVKKLLDKWLERAMMFKRWREALVKEAQETGAITLSDGRRRRFYDMRWKKGAGQWQIGKKVLKEIYNFPLIGTEVSFMNPRILCIYRLTVNGPLTQWILVLHEHDGFMLEGPEMEKGSTYTAILKTLNSPEMAHMKIDESRTLYVPFDGKGGTCWAELTKVTI
jgi:DNA polymerase I-like protein with 3'-5' exonuclease and polymerase domains